MRKDEISYIVEKQRKFFLSGKTLDVNYRINALKKLQKALKEKEEDINNALYKDLGKSSFESYMCEVGLTLSEINYMIRHIKQFSKKKNVYTPLAQFASHSYIQPCPYGVVLVMSPWNYPLLLSLEPLVDAIAAGNTVVLKPSNYSYHVSQILKEILESIFDEEYIAVITGGREENQALLDEQFDYIFFTGSKSVGHFVLEKAAKYLTPVTLELGGKSPCIIDKSANIQLAAKRIVWGKYLNCGQTCVAPDYILCHKDVKEAFVLEIKNEISKQFPDYYLENKEYGKMISKKHFDRVKSLIDHQKVIVGGKSDELSLKIEPTVMDNVTYDDKVMQEEIFGPIMPIMTYENIEDVITSINEHERPLALYIFSSNQSNIDKITTMTRYGGGCINDVIIHLATSEMGFGGIGESGMGSYHGKVGFDTFSHHKSIVDKKTWIDLPMRYHPFTVFNEKLLRIFLK